MTLSFIVKNLWSYYRIRKNFYSEEKISFAEFALIFLTCMSLSGIISQHNPYAAPTRHPENNKFHEKQENSGNTVPIPLPKEQKISDLPEKNNSRKKKISSQVITSKGLSVQQKKKRKYREPTYFIRDEYGNLSPRYDDFEKHYKKVKEREGKT